MLMCTIKKFLLLKKREIFKKKKRVGHGIIGGKGFLKKVYVKKKKKIL